MMKKNGTIKWIYKCSKRYLWMVGLLTIISMAISGSFILIAVVSKKILDIATKSTTGSILNTCVFLFGIIAFQAVANIISNNCRVRSQAKIENSMKEYLLTTLLHKEYQEIITLHSGELMNRFTSDIEIVAGGIVGFIPQMFSLFTKIIAGIWVLFTIDAKFTLIILIIGMITVVCSRLYSKKFRFLHKEVQQSQGIARSFMQECIENVIVIKSFVNEDSIKEQLEEKQNYNYQLRVKQNAISNLASTSIYVMMTTGYYVALGWGAIQISQGLLTFGTLTAFLQIIDQIKAPFRNVSGLIPRYDSMIASAARLMEIENLEDESKDHKIENIKSFYEQFEGIVLENGNFSYDDQIMIDAGTRNMFSYVPQGNMILSGTIKENILFGNQNASDKQIEQAIEIACLKEVIDELPEGINTVLKERGIGLSEGQRQRIAVARAIISEAPVLLLDECTASLDGDTEKKLLDNLKNFQQKTVLCISHRSAAIACCDLIIKVKDSKIYYE